MKRIVFACVHNAGRSQMARALFEQLADPERAVALSAGTEPAASIHPEVLHVMGEAGVDLSQAAPQRLTPELAAGASLLVTMGCGERCPYVPGLQVVDWAIEDPKGQPLERVRAIRDTIRQRVRALVEENGWAR